jgi:hypothetical protein
LTHTGRTQVKERRDKANAEAEAAAEAAEAAAEEARNEEMRASINEEMDMPDEDVRAKAKRTLEEVCSWRL